MRGERLRGEGQEVRGEGDQEALDLSAPPHLPPAPPFACPHSPLPPPPGAQHKQQRRGGEDLRIGQLRDGLVPEARGQGYLRAWVWA